MHHWEGVVWPGAARDLEAPRSQRTTVTQQYLAGELSSLLGELQSTPSEQLGAIRELRRRIECCPPQLLPPLAREAINLVDVTCWAALEQGEVGAFCDCARTAVALGEFTDNARLLGE